MTHENHQKAGRLAILSQKLSTTAPNLHARGNRVAHRGGKHSSKTPDPPRGFNPQKRHYRREPLILPEPYARAHPLLQLKNDRMSTTLTHPCQSGGFPNEVVRWGDLNLAGK